MTTTANEGGGSSSCNDIITIKITGMGHEFTFGVLPESTVADVKAVVEQRTGLPSGYQRLLARGSKLDDDDAKLVEIGVRNRTRMMLLHNDAYARDREGFDAITAVWEEMDARVATLRSSDKDDAGVSHKVVREIVTQAFCRLDGIEIHGSETLRYLRKKAIARAESLEKSLFPE